LKRTAIIVLQAVIFI